MEGCAWAIEEGGGGAIGVAIAVEARHTCKLMLKYKGRKLLNRRVMRYGVLKTYMFRNYVPSATVARRLPRVASVGIAKG